MAAEKQQPRVINLPVYGGDEWARRVNAEIAQRPTVIPLDKRHKWTPEELQKLRSMTLRQRHEWLKQMGRG